MTSRRMFLMTAISAGALALAATLPAAAADWRKDHPVLNISVISAENQSDLLARHEKFAKYLEQELGIKVKLTTATDYAGTIEAMRSKKAELAYFGPASYSRAWLVTGGNVEPVVIQTDANGNAFYQSVIVVKADSPYKSIDDLKGKTLAFADPNSTSGFQAPSYFLRKEGKAPDTFFAKTGFAGNHENGVLAVVNGTYDAAATWYNNDELSNFARMEGKGMIPKGSVRIIWKSPKLPESPYTVRKDLPTEMKAAIKQALLDLPTKAPDAWKDLTDGKSKGTVATSHENYVEIVNIVKENDRQRKIN